MSSEWNEITLGEFADINPSRSINKQSTTPFIEMAAIQSYTRDVPLSMITNRLFNGSGSKFKNGDVLLARITPCLENGKTALVSGLNDCFGHGSTELIVLMAKDDDDISYLYYLLISDLFRGYAIPRMEGTSGRQRVPNSAVAAYKFFCPPQKVRKDVGATLRALDDRIALLRETNTTLEAIAQALFKSWFVDFDPVRAKQEGREPEGMDADTAALFPDSFEESELGLVPKGWIQVPFTDTVNVIGGGTPKTSMPEYWNGKILWFSVVDAPQISDVFVIDTQKHISEQGLNNSSTKLLATGTTIISARGTVGRLALVGRQMAMNQSCYGLRGKAGDSFFTYFSTYRLIASLKQRSHGSVFDTITTETMTGVFIIYPDNSVIHAFEKLLNPVMDRILNNLEHIKTLTSLRDTILPRLISGQLRIPEAEALIEETTV